MTRRRTLVPSDINSCPACTVNLIYQSDTFRAYSRVIGIETDSFDGVLLWQCPDCGHRWHRWPEGTVWRKAAEAYLTGRPGDTPEGPDRPSPGSMET